MRSYALFSVTQALDRVNLGKWIRDEMTEYTDRVAKADHSNQKPQGGYDQWLMDQLIVIGERIASLESELKHHATKTDISNAKIWFITTSIGA
ncbi:MAG: hypothetical protein OXG98_00635, partial [Gemmatimonadetes bacterium]|nr:hypothetical protein [Gemmatimonadota bacterium]